MHRDFNELPAKVILWGGTGQAKAVRPVIEHYGSKVVAVFDDTPNLPSPFSDVDIYPGEEGFRQWMTGRRGEELGFCVAIGNPHGRVRLNLHDFLVEAGLTPITIADPSARIAADAIIGDGAQILGGATIAAEASLGRQCIINNHALIEHEATLGDAVEIAPNATVLGLTTIGANSFVGASATVLSRLKIGSDVVIGAGVVVSSDVPDKTFVAGAAGRAL